MSIEYLVFPQTTDPSGNKLMLGVAGTPPAPNGRHLDVWTPSEDGGAPNQRWTFVADPSNPGYFFIQNVQHDENGNPLVIDIHNASATQPPVDYGAKLEGRVRDTEWWENQLWQSVLDPRTQASFGPSSLAIDQYVYIQSYLTDAAGQPLVMDVQGWQPGQSVKAGTHVNAFPEKNGLTNNQQWQIFAPGDPKQPTPELLGFVSDTFSNVETVTIAGQGFNPGAVLVLQPQFGENPATLTAATPILCVSDLGGNLQVSATLVDLALGGIEGIFYLSVWYNYSNSATPAAAAQASWNGEFFTDFTKG